MIDRARHGQQIYDRTGEDGDCFRACMSVLLDVPNGDHIPHGIVEGTWWSDWHYFLWPMGLGLATDHAKGPIWKGHPWIASVPSKNLEDQTHAIVMHGAQVLFDPSTKKRYRPQITLAGKGIVLEGIWLEVYDPAKLEHFVKWRRKINRQYYEEHGKHATTISSTKDA